MTTTKDIATPGPIMAGKRGLELAAEAGSIPEAPAEIANEDMHTWPDDNLVLMGMGGPPVGAARRAEPDDPRCC